MPPVLPIASHASVEVAATPDAVWTALTDDGSNTAGPGLVGTAGLAYPVRGRLLGQGISAVRLGEFSTGIARERVTDWAPNRRLAFAVLTQPPAMEEMSSYRRVHSPHVQGKFDTGTTRFTLVPLPNGDTPAKRRRPPSYAYRAGALLGTAGPASYQDQSVASARRSQAEG